MAFCPQCGAESAAGARFCAQCGNALTAACSSCGGDLVPGARFCPSCGTPVAGAAPAPPPAAVAAPVPLAAPAPAPPPPAGAPQVGLGPQAVESRRTVTMLFCDVTGSTALGERLDPESMRQVMATYFAEIEQVIGGHGGTVEKFIGDAVMAAFGIPVLHEDDALRAVRAAIEMRDTLEALNRTFQRDWGVEIKVRTGVNTGEVVAGDASRRQTFATGDTVNVAARLEQAAAPGEILIGDATLKLVRDAVTVEAVEPLTLKGKAEPVPAYRLLSVDTDAPGLARRLSSPIVGRERELGVLMDAFETAAESRTCQLVTVLAPAGTGKSRVTLELTTALAERATVLHGRCIPYGEGITYFPLQLIVKQLAGIEDGESRERAREKLLAIVPETPERDAVAHRLAGAIGLDTVVARPEEISWATRHLFESLAATRPLLVVFDDIHWAEATFLDLIEYLAGFSRDAPILIVCPARPELADTFPGWASALPAAQTVVLEPLGPADTARLIANLLGDEIMDTQAGTRIVEAAEGNPLFVEEMLRMLVDDGLLTRSDGGWAATGDLSEVEIPPSIEAILAARLDRLEPNERAVLQRASVIGRVFGWGAVSELAPDELRSHVGASLQSLMRRELVRPDTSTLGGEDAFAFSHILIRDAAYRGVPKELRAEMHERFADWLEQRAGERAAEYEEIIGYHFEQAYEQRLGLGPLGERGQVLRLRAAERLASAGRRAQLRGDVPAADSLLRRAGHLFPEGSRERFDVQTAHGNVLAQLGRLEEAEVLLSTTVEQAAAAGEHDRSARAEIAREFVLLQTEPEGRSEAIVRVTDAAFATFAAAHDELGLARAWKLRSEIHRLSLRYALKTEALERALEHAAAAGEEREQAEIQLWLATSLCFGPTPVREAIARLRELLDWASGLRWVEAAMLGGLAYLESMHARFDDARELYGRSRAIFEELGMIFPLAGRAVLPASIEMAAGDLDAAERELTWSYDLLKSAGENELRSTIAAYLAQVLYGQGRDDEAEAYSRVSEETAAHDDISSQVVWRGARAKVLARRDGDPDAEALAREAVAVAAETDALTIHGEALLDLAEVLSLLGKHAASEPVVDDAAWLFERKDHIPATARALAMRLAVTERGVTGPAG